MLPKKLRSREKKVQLIKRFDWIFPKSSKKAIFVVKKNTDFSGNLRVCADILLKEGKHRLYVYKDDDMPYTIKQDLKKQGMTILGPNRWVSFYHILTSGLFIFSHVPRDAHLSIKHKKRMVLGLWHGVAFKNIESQMLSVSASKMQLIKNNAMLYDFMVASSEADRQYLAKSFLVDEKIIDITGLPRYELLKKDYPFKGLLRQQKDTLKNIKGHSKLILYAPTFRENNDSAFDQMKDDEWVYLNIVLKENNAILGLRPHSYDNKMPPTIIQKMSQIVWLSQKEFTESNLILQFTDILIVDFSSIWIDYLLLNRPIVGFAKDFEHYCYNERGFAYDFESTFPDVFTHDFNEFSTRLVEVLKNNDYNKNYLQASKHFHKYPIETDFRNNLVVSLKKLKVI